MKAILLRPLPVLLLVLAAVSAQAQGSGPQLVLHGELVYVDFEADGDDGRLDVMLANLSGLPLLDGVLLEVELLPAASGWVASWIHFSLDPPPSFGGADGLDIPGTWVVLGAELFADGFESGGLGAWASASP